jgi:2-aminoadipate transaminase
MVVDQVFSGEVGLAHWASNTRETAIQGMLRASSSPGVISFALGLPAPELFPAVQYSHAMNSILLSDCHSLQYGPPPEKLKAHIAQLMKTRGVECKAEEVFLTAGAQQGMSLLARLLLDPGSSVLVEDLTYPGFYQAVESLEPRVLTIQTSPVSGIQVDEIERLLKQGTKPALIYAMPNGHNPITVTMDLATRQRLAELAQEFRVPIIEDDAYGFLYYDHHPLPTLKQLAPEWVCYVGSFSKIMAPALRIGWVVAPRAIAGKLPIVKEATDINTGTLAQRAAAVYLDQGHFPGHLTNLRQQYRARRDFMLESITRHFPAGTQCEKPLSGIFLWVRLPWKIDTRELLRRSLREANVAFLPGEAFCHGKVLHNSGCMRLNYSNCSIEKIEDGIRRLGSILRSFGRCSDTVTN